mmetsp:Transcript_21957/g.55915  ORF Transcript_21957/g.55915 Transcript_21957/m.55915 type:complete len:252 (-) Transcript_21957:1016-1771(-)
MYRCSQKYRGGLQAHTPRHAHNQRHARVSSLTTQPPEWGGRTTCQAGACAPTQTKAPHPAGCTGSRPVPWPRLPPRPLRPPPQPQGCSQSLAAVPWWPQSRRRPAPPPRTRSAPATRWPAGCSCSRAGPPTALAARSTWSRCHWPVPAGCSPARTHPAGPGPAADHRQEARWAFQWAGSGQWGVQAQWGCPVGSAGSRQPGLTAPPAAAPVVTLLVVVQWVQVHQVWRQTQEAPCQQQAMTAPCHSEPPSA